MSEKEIINDEMIFQSFSKNYIFDSNKESNKVNQNEDIEFTFKKNLFNQKSDETPPQQKEKENKNTYKSVSAFNDQIQDIYSKNDNNIQESGDFGKSKYDSCKFKNIVDKNNAFKQPLLFIEEKPNRKYSKPNLSIKNIEKEESNLLNNKLRKCEIKKEKSKSKINSTIPKNNYIKNNNSYNRNKKSKIDVEPNSHLKGNNINNKCNKKNNNNNYENEVYNYMNRKIYNMKINDPVLNRLKKVKENNYYKENVNINYNKTNNNFNNSQIISNIMKPMNNNCSIVSINANDKKVRKISTSRIYDEQSKLKLNIINNQRHFSRNQINYKENKENTPINFTSKRNKILNSININYNNTIINSSHNRPPYFKEINYNNSINERPSKNPRISSKFKNDKNRNINIVNKYERTGNYLKLNEINFYPNQNDILSSSTTNLGYLMKNKIPRTIKNNELSFCNKINMIQNKSLGILKTKTFKGKINMSRENISNNNNFLIKSYFMKDNFGF